MQRRFLSLAFALLLAGCDTAAPPDSRQLAPTRQATLDSQQPRAARGLLRFTDSYERGFIEARREGKPLLLFFTAEWCHYCHQMADESFTNPQVIALSERFVCVLVDADDARDVCRQFRVTRFPTLQFVSPTGSVLNRLEGKLPVHKITIEMQAALQAVARRTPGRPAALR